MKEIKKEDQITIKIKNWSHTCGDGCCYTTGASIDLNGQELEHPDEDSPTPSSYVGDEITTAIYTVLRHLGYQNVTVIETYNDDDE